MKKYIFTIMMILLFVFSVSGSAFAASLKPVRVVYFENLEYPYLGEKIDREATVKRGECTIDKIVWYFENVKTHEDTFLYEGTYTCRIYITPFEGYGIPSNINIGGNVDNEDKDTALGSDQDGYFCELKYYVTNRMPDYPEKIYFKELTSPSIGKVLDYEMISNAPEFYNYSKIEWYSNGELLHPAHRAQDNTVYTCKVYIELYNGFELNSGIVATIGRDRSSKITRDLTGTYFEIDYTVGKKRDEKEISKINVVVSNAPFYGQAKKQVSIAPLKQSNYYKLSDVEWFHDDYRMIDEYFYDGKYRCRIYIDLINGGFFSEDLEIEINTSSAPKTLGMFNNRFYIEETFDIKKVKVTTFKFDNLNTPVYSGVQDMKINSLEPGMYTPSMVYWYKDGKYMSNIERFLEGTYKCKFSLTLNSSVELPTKLNATINGQAANIYMENNKLTIDKTYEVKKPTKMWTKASDWAIKELEDALNNALIPNSLNNKNYTQNITRAEFAAVAVKMYEQLTLKAAVSADSNPFSDTNDSEILKAFALGITNGTSATTFEPNSLITRQEMATMMVRALEKADVSTSVNLNTVKKFADHAKIESWALNGVYFMSNAGIIKGKGNNTFDVLGNATREEALAISIRSVNKYK